ncbi:unnamed protein product [Chilo suppressalis]|uniref:Lipase domain-containing protein n=1 Tax=Chilo suppressalis TaxID=168631 RepID=A0ABN8L8I4_CHISP|nr:unnamed protein product [Chilo suppressalis]
MESALPAIHPLIAAGSNRCETLKSYFGLTYEQMTGKNITSFYDSLEIDHITKKGSIKYNMTESRRMSRHLPNFHGTVVLVHGFLESSDGVMVKGVAPVLMKKPGLLLLALDGRKLINLEYFRSSTYARFMGEHLGEFLNDLVTAGQDPSKITLIGHSLGAHIAGIAGKKFRQLTGKQIGRITGLDPAGPCFSNVSAAGRLGADDAEYVDVIHTSSGILGQREPVGKQTTKNKTNTLHRQDPSKFTLFGQSRYSYIQYSWKKGSPCDC